MSKQLKKTTDTITKQLKNLSKNRTRSIALGIIAFILVSFVMVQGGHLILEDYLDYGAESQSSVTCGVYGYKDGEFIPIPLESDLLSPFRIGGVEYSEIAPKVDWVSEGAAIDWSTFTLTGSMEVKYLTEVEKEGPGGYIYYVMEWQPFLFIPFSSTVASGSWHEVFVLGTDLCLDAHYIEDRKTGANAGTSGWGYSFSGSVYGSVYDEFGGGPLTDSASFGGLAIWITYEAGYSLDASIV
jgi:hypothetical protein